ncbi:uncharacterized protein LOC135371214 [Ornithodoros turicata]|uniref:uncharacterized protein LOC135371214 n=1 Tax=Ornithodoros turicata TaxID=34597 RepID=UPI003138CAFE
MESSFQKKTVQTVCESAALGSHNIESGNRCEESFDAEEECWQELEAFWGAEKQRCQKELPIPSSSTEDQLERQDFLSEPPVAVRKSTTPVKNRKDSLYIVRGEDINDVPTSYVVSGLRPHEFPVIGTFVDPRIIPGFRYRVRVNSTQRVLFDGRALRLDSIGRGYGKRLTFEPTGSSLNENDNFFYSDTIAQGFGFSPIAIEVGEKFRVRHVKSEEYCGELVCSEIARPQEEISSTASDNRRVEKEIKVNFYAKFQSVSSRLLDRQLPWHKVRVSGVAVLVKEAKMPVAVLDRIVVEESALTGYELVPSSRGDCEE